MRIGRLLPYCHVADRGRTRWRPAFAPGDREAVRGEGGDLAVVGGPGPVLPHGNRGVSTSNNPVPCRGTVVVKDTIGGVGIAVETEGHLVSPRLSRHEDDALRQEPDTRDDLRARGEGRHLHGG